MNKTQKNVFKLVGISDEYEVYKNEATGFELWASPEALTIRDAHWRPVGEVDGWRYGRPSAHPDYDEWHRLHSTLVVEWYYT